MGRFVNKIFNICFMYFFIIFIWSSACASSRAAPFESWCTLLGRSAIASSIIFSRTYMWSNFGLYITPSSQYHRKSGRFIGLGVIIAWNQACIKRSKRQCCIISIVAPLKLGKDSADIWLVDSEKTRQIGKKRKIW